MPVDTEFLKSIGLDDESVQEKLISHINEGEAGLVSKRDELLEKLNGRNTELTAIQERYNGIDPDAYKTMAEKLEALESKDLTADERLEKEREKIKKEYQLKLDELSDERATLASELDKERTTARTEKENAMIMSAVGNTGDGDLILDVIRMKGLSESVESDGKWSMKFHSIDKSKEHDNIDALLAEMKASDKYRRLFNSSGLSGGDARQSRKTGQPSSNGAIGAAKMANARAKG